MDIQKHNGIVLVSVLILLASMTLVAVTIANRSTMDEQIAANTRDYVNAMMVAESGLEAGFATAHNPVNGYSDLGQALCDVAAADPPTLVSGSTSDGKGSYTVSVKDCVAGTKATLQSVGSYNGSQRQLELVMSYTPGESGGGAGSGKWSILADGYIEFTNTQYFSTGALAGIFGIHTNANMKVNDMAIVEDMACLEAAPLDPSSCAAPTAMMGLLSAVETIDPPSDLTNWDIMESAAEEAIPHVYPPDWRPYATVVLTWTGQAVAGPNHPSLVEGALIADIAGGDAWGGMKYDSARWIKNAPDAPSEFLYIEGNLELQSCPEYGDPPWNVSIVSAGSMKIPKACNFGTYAGGGNTTGNPTADNIFLLSGNDISFTGAAGVVYEGIIATHGELELRNKGLFKGAFIMEGGKHHGDGAHFCDYHGEVHPAQTDSALQESCYNPANCGELQKPDWLRLTANKISNQMALVGTGIGLSPGGSSSGGEAELRMAAWREIID